ncbi:MAG: hypothetical protein P1U87_21390 [Verrucomicrobiales bacterium]|nr:hypothetical protein [Verrucomicrobiales bacterium]
MKFRFIVLFLPAVFLTSPGQSEDPSTQQLSAWLKRFPKADANGDGVLTAREATDFRKTLRSKKGAKALGRGAPRQFEVDPGWEAEAFPDHAVSLRPPEEIAAIYEKVTSGKGPAVTSYEKPATGALRIVGTGHSFMAPGYRTFPVICRASGFEQPLFTHTGGGITGSTRYKWEQENGIFEFDGKPNPKLLASIANAEWEAMMWGPYFNDRPDYYSCWMEFCLKYNPGMKFYLSDAWPQLYQLEEKPKSEDVFTPERLEQLSAERRVGYVNLVGTLREEYPDKVFILPTCDAMVLAAQHFLRGELPGIEGIHSAVGKKEERALWRDELGHLGPGFDRLEGYVFYATLYGRSPELIEGDIDFGGSKDFPCRELDRVFRKIAWQAVTGNQLSGVVDEDGDGLSDSRDL